MFREDMQGHLPNGVPNDKEASSYVHNVIMEKQERILGPSLLFYCGLKSELLNTAKEYQAKFLIQILIQTAVQNRLLQKKRPVHQQKLCNSGGISAFCPLQKLLKIHPYHLPAYALIFLWCDNKWLQLPCSSYPVLRQSLQSPFHQLRERSAHSALSS